jgi:GT2 family glycosyltransferase
VRDAGVRGQDNVDLSIIVVSWNTRELLARCLESVRSDADTMARRRVETFVVDNASTDGSARMVCSSFPWVRLVENAENTGFARANNQAIAEAGGRFMLLLNSDTVVRSGALETLVVFMENHPRAGACGARLLNVDGTLQPACHPMLTPARELWRLLFLDGIFPRATYPMHRWDTTTPRQVDVIKGACFLVRRSALQEVGSLDESYFMYTEEVDLCHRLALAGWERWWVPEAEVLHEGEASSRQAPEAMYLQLYRSKLQFYRKTGGQSRANRFKCYVRLAYWPRWVLATLGAPFSGALTTHARTSGT